MSTAYGCTEPYFLIREAFQRRTAMQRYDEFRRPGYSGRCRHELREDDADHQGRRVSRFVSRRSTSSTVRMYDEREYNQTTTSADFGRINRNVTGQSNFQRFVQMGFRLIF